MEGDQAHNLPVRVTSFVGREHVLDGVQDRLVVSPLVTLVGPGGAGKSRLAVEVGLRSAGRFPDGVWLVELTTTDVSHAHVAGIHTAVMAALELPQVPGISVSDVLARHLASRTALIILDNCEYIVEAVAEFVTPLMQRCEQVRFLATSTQRLGVEGEVLWPVEGLEVPEEEGLETLTATLPEAMELFEERGKAVDPGFEITDTNAASVGSVCRHLDGLPLAIELAAARLGTFAPAEIDERIGDDLRFLTSPVRVTVERHESLASVISWSYELLSEDEKRIFSRLGVFVGGFDLDIGWSVAGIDMERSAFENVIELLVGKSFLTRVESRREHTRFRLLETLRAFAAETLTASGTEALLRNRHADAYASLADVAHDELWGVDQVAWLDRIESEHDDIRAALNWYLDKGQAEGAQRISGPMARFWDLRGHYREGLEWCRRASSLKGEVPSGVAIKALNGLATLAVLNGEGELAVTSCESAIALARQTADDWGLAYALQFLALTMIYAGEDEEAREVLAESIEAAERAQSLLLQGWAGVFLCAIEIGADEADRAYKTAVSAHDHLAQVGDAEGLGWTLIAQAAAEWMRGRPLPSAKATRASYAHFRALRAGWGTSAVGLLAANLWFDAGDVEVAVKLLSWSELLRTAVGAVHHPALDEFVTGGRTRAVSEIGELRFHDLWNEAEAVSPTDVPDLVGSELDRLVGSLEAGELQRAPKTDTAVLRREGDVWLVAHGSDEARVRHVIGFQHLATLLSSPHQEFLALELATATNPRVPRSAKAASMHVGTGDAGPALDAQAIRAYKDRLVDLHEELDQAERWSDDERATRAQSEIDQITAQLSASVGLGGRSRRVSSNAERARVNATKALRSAVSRITAVSPLLGRHLEASIVTGTFCVYRPDPSSPLAWKVEVN